MRDLIDRAELLRDLNRLANLFEKEADISDSFLNGYRAAIREVINAAAVEKSNA
jgi:hypothetical protein